jgi:hypothetical protein
MASAAVLIVLVLLVDRWPRTAPGPDVADRDDRAPSLNADEDPGSANGSPEASVP